MQLFYGQGIGNEAIRLIDKAQPGQGIGLVSAYFKPWHRLDIAMRNALARGVKMVIIVRGGGGREEEARLEAAAPYRKLGAQVGVLEALHAKFLLTPDHFLLTSMNFYEFSDQNSWEVAARFDREVDDEAWAQRLDLWKSLLMQVDGELQRRRAEQEVSARRERAEFVKEVAKVMNRPRTVQNSPRTVRSPSGHCIRCGEATDYNPSKPHCARCYKRWARYKNPEYEESFCHGCGKEKKTSQMKPLCRPCYKQAS